MNAAPLKISRSRACRRRAFLVLDMVVGLILALLLLMVITVAVVKQQHAEKQLGSVRLAHRAAEAAILSLQAGQNAPSAAVVEPLSTAAPPGYRWVRLTLRASGNVPAASLIGLVPAGARHPEAGQ